MPNINLIAARREEKRRLERTTRQLFFGVAGSLGVLMTLGLYLAAERLTVSSELREIEARMQKLQPKLDETALVKKDTAELMPKVTTLRDAKTGTQKWRAILQVISQAVPEQTWLTNMSATQIADDTTLNLSGVSGTQALVGETMTRLNTHPLFDKVELGFTQATMPTTEDPTSRVQFQINAHLRSAAKPDAKKADAAGSDSAGKSAALGHTVARKEAGNV